MLDFVRQQSRNQSGFLARSAGRDRSMPKPVHDNNHLLAQHQALGNQAMLRLAESCPLSLPSASICPTGGACHACPAKVQAKLKIGQPGDKYEQEADRVADEAGYNQQSNVGKTEEAIGNQRISIIDILQQPVDRQFVHKTITSTKKRNHGKGKSNLSLENEPVDPISFGLTNLIQKLNSNDQGTPLGFKVRRNLELQLGYKLKQIRIHTGRKASFAANLLGTRAFTVGNDIYLHDYTSISNSGEGGYSLIHEIVHSLQQTAFSDSNLPFGAISLMCSDNKHEQEAQQIARELSPVSNSSKASLHLSKLPIPITPLNGLVLQMLHPAVWALIAGELACIFGFFLYALTRLSHRSDAWLHCWTSCKIATWCPPIPLGSQAIAALIGALKEICDIVIGEAELRDMINNLHGVACSSRYFTKCSTCCDEKERAGELASAHPDTETQPAMAFEIVRPVEGIADDGVTRSVVEELSRSRLEQV